MSKNLDESVRSGLVSRKGDWLTIATAAGVSHSWISKFVNGHIKNPGYLKLLRLQEHMKGTKRKTANAEA